MAHVKNHDYHVLPPSIWPFVGAVGGFVMLFGSVLWMHGSGPWLFLIGLAAVLYTMYGWWADVVAESSVGDHTPVVRIGLRYGFILFNLPMFPQASPQWMATMKGRWNFVFSTSCNSVMSVSPLSEVNLHVMRGIVARRASAGRAEGLSP